MTGRSILRRTCALPVMVRAMPENEIPPAMRVDYYFLISFCVAVKFAQFIKRTVYAGQFSGALVRCQ